MKNKIKALLFSSIALLAGACTEDLPDYRGDYTLSGEGSLPIEFEFSLPDDPDTRANAPSYPKVEFEEGDVIHIMGIFQMENGQPRRTYGAYYFTENRQWEPLLSAADNGTGDESGTGDGNDSGSTDPGDSTDPSDPGTSDPGDTDPSDPDDDTPETSSVPKMVWPDKCTSASFRAYYLKQLNGAMVAGSETEYILLSKLAGTGSESDEIAKDPLSAGIQNVVYGHTVKLNFIHACTYLTVEELQAGISNTFWLMCDNNQHLAYQETGTGTTNVPFNNAFKLTLSEQNELKLEFGQVPDNTYLTTQGDASTGALYVAGRTVNYTGEDGMQKSKVGFYLEPGIYNQFVLGYPMTKPDYNRYFSYTKSSSAEGTDDHQNNYFKENNAYTFNVAKDSGVKMEGNAGNENWDENGEIVYLLPVEVEEFLYAINKGQSYRTQDHNILEATQNGTKLLVNVDFQNYYYDQFGPDDNVTPQDNPRPIHPGEWFNPTNESEFDGNHRYIYNLGAPLFNENNGTIKDLGINGVNAKNIILSRYYEKVDEERNATATIDLSYRGAICCNNLKTISNLRVKNVSISALSDPEQTEEGEQEAYSYGGLVGYNQGTLEEVYLYGYVNLSVANYSGNTIVPTINMGGLVGQNMGSGYITNINPLEGSPAITLTNTCNGNKALYNLGGISGGNVGTISEIYLPNVTVISSGSKGKWSYIGGLVGVCSESSTGSLISNCIVSGSVTAGEVANEAGAVAYGASYTGGEVGNFNITASITGCRTVVSVTGPQPNMVKPTDITYGVGGAFGRITASISTASNGTIDNLVVNGTDLKGPEPIGTFAGIVPAGTTWDLNALNVIVKAHNNTNGQAISEIGQTM